MGMWEYLVVQINGAGSFRTDPGESFGESFLTELGLLGWEVDKVLHSYEDSEHDLRAWLVLRRERVVDPVDTVVAAP